MSCPSNKSEIVLYAKLSLIESFLVESTLFKITFCHIYMKNLHADESQYLLQLK
jgi:hypothetical protein